MFFEYLCVDLKWKNLKCGWKEVFVVIYLSEFLDDGKLNLVVYLLFNYIKWFLVFQEFEEKKQMQEFYFCWFLC